MTEDEIYALKSNLHATFDSPQGKEVMKYLEKICAWYPKLSDSNDVNAIIARDANRKVIATIKTILELSPEQIIALQEGL